MCVKSHSAGPGANKFPTGGKDGTSNGAARQMTPLTTEPGLQANSLFRHIKEVKT